MMVAKRGRPAHGEVGERRGLGLPDLVIDVDRATATIRFRLHWVTAHLVSTPGDLLIQLSHGLRVRQRHPMCSDRERLVGRLVGLGVALCCPVNDRAKLCHDLPLESVRGA
jgi:hypothetical protein